MLTKPLSHLRPLLRLQSHTHTTHTQPDHFTANPSLPHHLPRRDSRAGRGSSTRTHALAQPGAAHTAGHGGGAKGAGQGRGYGRESGAGSGYTGHARAFLALPQGSHVDPNAGLASDETRDDFAIPTALIRPARATSRPSVSDQSNESLFRDVRYRQQFTELELSVMEEQFGGVSELASGFRTRSTEDVDVVVEAQPSRRQRRSSISIAQLSSASRAATPATGSPRLLAPSPLPTFLPGHGPALSRTSSMMDIGLLGTIPGRPVSRAMSSVSVSRAESPQAELTATPPIPTIRSASSTRLVPQANRILMDLAGRDIPSSRRYNSTAAATRGDRSWNDDVFVQTASSRPLSSPEMQDRERDYKIYQALRGAVDHNQTALFQSLVKHYRSARVLAPYDERSTPGDPAFARKFPLPSTWTVNTYNVILQGLNQVRLDGESVAQVLEIYNEMLERDVLPNGRTYAAVIHALSMRERDVWNAVQRWETITEWEQWRQDKLGLGANEGAQEKRELIEGYIAEGNMVSALRLFRAAVTFHNTSGWKFQPETYFQVLEALSVQRTPDFDAVDHVFDHAYKRTVTGWRSLSRFVFSAYAKRRDPKYLVEAWEAFEVHMKALQDGKAEFKIRDWVTRYDAAFDDQIVSMALARGQIRLAYEAAIDGLMAVGEVERAQAVFKTAVNADLAKSKHESGDYKVSSDLYASYLISLARYGQAEKAAQEYERLGSEIQASLLGRLPLAGILELVDWLVPGGQWRIALTLLREGNKANIVHAPDEEGALAPKQWLDTSAARFRLRKVYNGLLAEAASAQTADEARAALDLTDDLFRSTTGITYAETQRAFEIITQHKLWDLGALHARTALLTQVSESSHGKLPPALNETLKVFVGQAVNALPLRAATKLYSHFHGMASSVFLTDIAERYWSKYTTERAALSDAHGGQQDAAALQEFMEPNGWRQMLLVMQQRRSIFDSPAFKDGEYDAALEQMMKDYETLRQVGVAPDTPLSDDPVAYFLLVLRDRFGPDRMRQMAQQAFGDRADRYMDSANKKWRREHLENFEIPAAASMQESANVAPESIDSASQTSLSEDGHASSATSFAPSTPASVNAAPAATHKLDPALTAKVEDLLKQMIGSQQRQGTLAQQAYAAIAQGFEAGRVPALLPLARVITNLRRPSDEGAVRHLYDIAQVAIASFSGSQTARAMSWRSVEDSMIIACCHLGRLEQAGAHRARIIESGMTPSPDAYATMIASSKDTTDDALVAREMFDESQRLGVKPNLYLYNTIISKLSKARKVELALELFAHMKAAGIRPSSVTYGAVMNACTRVGDAQSAENLFEEMRMQPNFKPRVPPYNTMIQLFVQTTPNREKALHYYGLLRAVNVPPSAHTYKLLLDLHATLPPFDLAAAERVFADIEADPSVDVQGSHCASLITGYGIYADDLTKALETFERIYARPDSAKILQEAVVWEAVLNVIAHRGTLQQLEEMRARMESSENVRPTAYVYNVLITGYARTGQMDTARNLFESMGDGISGVAAPNNHPILHTSTGLPKPSTRTTIGDMSGPDLQGGVEQTVFREPSTYEAMLRAELSVGEVQRAQDVMRRMEHRGYPWAVVARARAVLDEAIMAHIAESQPVQNVTGDASTAGTSTA